MTNYMAIPGLMPGTKLNIFRSPEYIMKVVSEILEVPIDRMKSIHRKRKFVVARQVAIYLIRKNSTLSLSAIGKMFGDRDHTTAIHSINTVKDLCSIDNNFRKMVLNIENNL